MRKLKLAVIFDQEIHAGGGYQQAMNAALLAKKLSSKLVSLIFFTTLKSNLESLASHNINAQFIKLSFFDKLTTFIRRSIFAPRLYKFLKIFQPYSPFERKLIQAEVDLVYFLSSSVWARDLEQLNYITTVWDLSHRDDPEFPEVRWNRQFEAREKNYIALLARATAILVDSELGKKNVVQRYCIDADRVHVIPFEAAVAVQNRPSENLQEVINVRKKYNLSVPYIFYPAQFWAHKNHVYILEGLRALEALYKYRIGVIFSGVDKGSLSYIKSLTRNLNLENRVKFAGFVGDHEIPDLYLQSIALVMPSYFGPTNLPPLEAFKLGVPVLYSNKPGLSDQVGNAALLMDLKDPNSMALHLKNVIEDDELRNKLITAGYSRLRYFSDYDRLGTIQRIIENFAWRRLCWD